MQCNIVMDDGAFLYAENKAFRACNKTKPWLYVIIKVDSVLQWNQLRYRELILHMTLTQ